MRHLWMAAALVGCGDMAAEATLVDELTIVNLALEPASPVAGEALDAILTVADPVGDGFETWSWICVDNDCSESAVPGGELAVLYGLACAPGVCSGPGELSTPDVWMADLPIDGVSLSRRIVPISPSADFRINANPTFVGPADLPETLAAGETLPLAFAVDDFGFEAPRAYGLATAGGFRSAEGRDIVDGAVTVEFFAPEEPGEAELFVVFEDGIGGSAVWTERIDIQ